MGLTDRRFRVRLLAVILGLVVLMVGGVLVCMELTLGRTLRAALAHSVDASATAVGERLRADLDRLAREATLVAQEPRLRALVATAGADQATIVDTLEELQVVTRWDLAGLVAPDGSILALRGAEQPPTRIDDPRFALGPTGDGYLRVGAKLYRVALAPIAFGDTLAGRVLAAQEISDELLGEAARSTGNAVAVAWGGTVMASSAPLTAERRPATLAPTAGEVLIGSERFLATPVPLGATLTAVVLRSSDEAMRPYLRTRRLIWFMGAIALYAGVILAWLMSYRLSRPVTTLQQMAVASSARAERQHVDMQRLMDSIPDGVAVQVDGQFVYANQAMARILGRVDAGELVGNPAAAVIHPEDRPAYAQLVGGAGGAQSGEGIRLQTATGAAIETEMAALPVDFGGTHAVVTVAHDVRLRKAYEARLLADRAAAKELEVARAIQREMVPSEEAIDRGFVRLAGHFEPAAECGGDWWSFHDLVDGKLLVLIGDVTGHGISSAMITVAAKAASDVVCSMHGGDVSVERVLEVMNVAIHNAAKQRFVMTCFAAIFDPRSRTVTFANAGHNFPFVCRGSAGDLSSLMTRGEPLGHDVRSKYDARTVGLKAGDVLLFYSDGLLEAAGEGGEAYGMRRLRDTVRRGVGLEPAVLRDNLAESYLGFIGRHARRDDVTFVVAKVR